MVTKVLQILTQWESTGEANQEAAAMGLDFSSIDCARIKASLQCAVLIGGVSPPTGDTPPAPISLPSLHIIGENDPLIDKCHRLTQLYSDISRTVLHHTEDHRVPTMATHVYPSIHTWLQTHIKLPSKSK